MTRNRNSDPRFRRGKFIGHPAAVRRQERLEWHRTLVQKLGPTPLELGWQFVGFHAELHQPVYQLAEAGHTAKIVFALSSDNGPGWLLQTTRSDRTWHFSHKFHFEAIHEDVLLILRGEAAA